MGFSRKTFAHSGSFFIPGNQVIIGDFIYPVEQVCKPILLIRHNSESGFRIRTLFQSVPHFLELFFSYLAFSEAHF